MDGKGQREAEHSPVIMRPCALLPDIRIRICLILFLLSFSSYGMASIRLHNSAAALCTNGISMLYTDSDLRYSPSSFTGFSYQNPYGQPGLNLYHISFAARDGSRNYGSSFSQLTVDDYMRQDYSISLTQSLGFISLSAQQILILEDMQSRDSYRTWQTDFSALYQISRFSFQTGLQNAWDSDSELHAELVYLAMPTLKLGAGYTRDEYRNPAFSIGSAYRLGEYLQVLSSWQNEPSQMGYGLEFSIARLKLLYAIRTHPQLKTTHAVQLVFGW
ncbi:MAG: hypothetical protein U1C33_08815 [Candidatus Cloacimonadaceae bacterium]|nr:hypothetical protein [Candidatus Cloacimonadaceae bacterium]